ncbi:MAG: histidine triad nucleotide-binding protein [Parachlamydiales bacterium]|jgi:histidine triad (HIT) family protein
METIFEKIIARKLPATIVYEDDNVIAINDIHPAAPVHILIVSKKVIPSIQELKSEDLGIVNKMIQVAQKIAKDKKIEKGYRLLTNVGTPAGQTIFHLHFHLIGGRDLRDLG